MGWSRKDYLTATKQRKKGKKTIRQALRKQLGYVRRNLKTIEKLLNEKNSHAFSLALKTQKNQNNNIKSYLNTDIEAFIQRH